MATRGRKRWSQRVTEKSNALDLEQGVFSRNDPRSIARSLKRSADRSQRRKSEPFRPAMSMLTFYLNRAGKKLSRSRRKRLEAAERIARLIWKAKAPGGLMFRAALAKETIRRRLKYGQVWQEGF